MARRKVPTTRRKRRTRRTRRTRATKRAAREESLPKRKPTLTEVRYHPKTGLMYIYEFNPGNERPAWLRYDTWVRGRWRDFPHRTAREQDLREFDRRALRLETRVPFTIVRMKFF